MFNDIKQRIKKLGFISIELVIIGSIVLAGGFIGVDKLMKNSTGVINTLDDASYEEFKATKSELTIKIIGRNHVNYLYDVGEPNLTEDDIVQINGVDCYVLKVENDKAELITKNVYLANFDDGGHNPVDVEYHVGDDSYADKTYDYKYSTLRVWMYNFYINELGQSSKILPSDIKYYYQNNNAHNLSNYYEETLYGEYVFPLDVKEGIEHSDKFSYERKSYYDKGFWLSAASIYAETKIYGHNIAYDGGKNYSPIASNVYGARPAFWISLD